MTVTQKRFALLCLVVFSVLLFSFIAWLTETESLAAFDGFLQKILYDSFHSAGDLFFIGITYVGSANVSFPVLTVLLIIFLFQKRFWTALLLAVNLIGIRQLNWLLKSAFDRQRPELEHLVRTSSESFPSGHAMNSIAFFGFLAFLLSLSLKRSGKPVRLVWGAAAALVLFIGASRVYLGVHYPSDVIGGFLAGGAWLFFCIFLYSFIPGKERF